jgi:two-component system OmpR family response regulator
VLDLGLPKLDGASVLKKWRNAGKKMPVLILTARDRGARRSRASMPAPTTTSPSRSVTEELLARLRALMRRAAGHASAALDLRRPASVDTARSAGEVNGEPIKLTAHEFAC